MQGHKKGENGCLLWSVKVGRVLMAALPPCFHTIHRSVGGEGNKRGKYVVHGQHDQEQECRIEKRRAISVVSLVA